MACSTVLGAGEGRAGDEKLDCVTPRGSRGLEALRWWRSASRVPGYRARYRPLPSVHDMEAGQPSFRVVGRRRYWKAQLYCLEFSTAHDDYCDERKHIPTMQRTEEILR